MKTFGLFAKRPTPGTVKTRLAETLGFDMAATLYAAFLDDLTFRFRNVGDRRLIGYAPADAADYFQRFFSLGYELWRQPDGDLGERMSAFFREALLTQDSRAVLIGSDSPSIPYEFVQRAFDLLTSVDCVLGPATDGGYYLIGLRQPQVSLFRRMAWSSPGVLSQTINRIETAGLKMALLPPWYDVDTNDDLQALIGHLRGMTSAGETHPCPTTASALRSLVPGNGPSRHTETG